MNQIEEFKKIENFGNYSISNFGNVRNDKTMKILKPNVDGSGYKKVNLCKDNKTYTVKIHRLVASAFLPNPENKKCVDHINGDRTDNNISNLRWASSSENGMNRKKQINNISGIAGVDFHKLSNKWRATIRINNKFIHLGLFESLEDAEIARVKKANELFGDFTSQIEKAKLILIKAKEDLDKLEEEFNNI